MRWLLHGPIQPATIAALRRHGHDARLPADVGVAADAPLGDVLQSAHKNQLDVITADPEVAPQIYDQRLIFDRSIVLLNVGIGDVEQDDAIDRLFVRYKRLSPGRLYTVTNSRVKIRQLPGRL